MPVSVSLLAISGALRVASLDLCADEYLLLLARPGAIASVSRVAQDPADSVLWRQARRYPANQRGLESAALPGQPARPRERGRDTPQPAADDEWRRARDQPDCRAAAYPHDHPGLPGVDRGRRSEHGSGGDGARRWAACRWMAAAVGAAQGHPAGPARQHLPVGRRGERHRGIAQRAVDGARRVSPASAAERPGEPRNTRHAAAVSVASFDLPPRPALAWPALARPSAGAAFGRADHRHRRSPVDLRGAADGRGNRAIAVLR
jgi:hypothetical protein